MMVLLGSARSQFGHPESGDQTGKEVSTQSFYLPSCGYWLGFKPKNNLLGVNIAKQMLDACDNNNLGYNQKYRITGRQAYCKYGSIKNIKEKCTVDCSSLVNLCCLAAGVSLPNFNTASEPTVLRNSGLFDEVKVTKPEQCTTGMILCTPTKGHTLIVVTALSNEIPNTYKTVTVPTARPNLKKGSKGDNVRKLQNCLNYVLNVGLVEDGIFGSKTDSALRSFQHKYGLVVDGIYGKNSKAKLQEVIG